MSIQDLTNLPQVSLVRPDMCTTNSLVRCYVLLPILSLGTEKDRNVSSPEKGRKILFC